MEVAIAGGHGQIGLLLGKILVERGHAVFGLIRNPEQEDNLHAVGVEPVICDLEGDDDVADAVSGAEAVVFAAGAGPGSGAERKLTMDLGGARKLIDAAKAEADRALVASGLAHTIVRPGGLTDDPPTGLVQLGERLRRGEIPRADVAAVLAAVLETDNTIGRTFDLVSGEVPVAQAVSEL
jgi:nucleoside-diphosphate-sugar epimerase